jgi:hypothetical protein
MPNLSPPPLTTPAVELSAQPGIVVGAFTKTVANWLQELANRSQQAASSRSALSLTAQNAALPTTIVIAQANGLYRVSYRLRVRTPGSVSSSIGLTVLSTEGGVACTQSSAAYAGNATNAPLSGSFLVHCDPSSPLSVSTTYASNVAGTLQYDVDASVEVCRELARRPRPICRRGRDGRVASRRALRRWAATGRGEQP